MTPAGQSEESNGGDFGVRENAGNYFALSTPAKIFSDGKIKKIQCQRIQTNEEFSLLATLRTCPYLMKSENVALLMCSVPCNQK